MSSRQRTWTSHEIVLDRSMSMCEAMFKPPDNPIFRRCWMMPIEVHHLLTRARGGTLLDRVGEDYHLIALCRDCHARCDGEDAYMNRLLIEGYVSWDKAHHMPVYLGPDEYLTEKYGKTKAGIKNSYSHYPVGRKR